MFDRVRSQVLRALRVPHEPEPPAGAPGSVRVFRAGRNFYYLKLIAWGAGQIGALGGIIFSLAFLARVEREVDDIRRERERAAVLEAQAAAQAAAEPAAAPEAKPAAPAAEEPAKKGKRPRRNWKDDSRLGLSRMVDRSPEWLFPLIRLLEYGGVLLYLLQIPVTYAMVRLDYEQRWYIVTDRSLRIRSGLASVLESTMSFANLQQVSVSQGPVQRLLGLADVKVQSAGGGGAGEHPATAGDSLHSGLFHCVEHADEIRDLILERLRLFRQAGLGDPDEGPAEGASDSAPPPDDALVAARELLEEARALRAALVRPPR